MTTAAPATHLEYYLQHGLNPVQYEMADPLRHLQRRGSLYRSLGITPLMIRGARVLEVAPGSGQNSLFLASCSPRSLTLVEPNPAGIRDIEANYARFPEYTRPSLVNTTLQQYAPEHDFEVVVCENWLGSAPSERALLRKLGGLVVPQGVLVITTVSPVGVVWNVLRKALACRLVRPTDDFATRTAVLAAAFGPHLATLPGMTRNVTDWVHDNVMNPAYFGIMLSIPMALAELGDRFDVLGSSPRFAVDWRWFKLLVGEERRFNGHFLEQYASELHNFLDYRSVLAARDSRWNHALEQACVEVCQAAAEYEARAARGEPPGAAGSSLLERVREVQHALAGLPKTAAAALGEFIALFHQKEIAPEQVARMPEFSRAFGRETVYVSWERSR